MKALRILLAAAVMLALLTVAPTAAADDWEVTEGELSAQAAELLSQHPGLTARKLTVFGMTDAGLDDGIPLYEVYRGDGSAKPLVIVLHGAGGSKEVFFKQAVRFAEEGFYAVAIDAAGSGESQIGPIDAVKAWEKTVSQIDTLIEYYSTVPQADAQRFALYGNSMGATIIYAYVVHGHYRPTAIVPMKGTPDFTSLGAGGVCFDHGQIIDASVMTQEERDAFAAEYSPMNHPEKFLDLYIYAGTGLADSVQTAESVMALESWLTDHGGMKHFFFYYLNQEHGPPFPSDYNPFDALRRLMLEGGEPLVTISGRVTAKDGSPLAGVTVSTGDTVTYEDETGTQNSLFRVGGRSAVTDENGAYRLESMTRDCMLRFSLAGYATQTREVSAADPQPDIILNPLKGNVPVTEEYFPDNIFREYVRIVWDTDQNGFLDEEEIARAETVDLTIDENLQGKTASLEGIQYFTQLKWLIAKDMPLLIEPVDLSHNTMLRSIDVTNSALTGIRLGDLPELESLRCKQARPGTLDVSGCPSLRELVADACALDTLDVSKNPLLEVLLCPGNRLSALDLRQNPKLTILWCNHNPLTSLNLSKNKELEILAVFNTGITGLDLSRNPKLRSLSAQYAPIPVLDISPCPALLALLDSALYKDKDDRHLYETGTDNTDSRLFYSKTTLLKTSADQRFDILELPAGLKRIEKEAFAGIAADLVILPQGCENVGSRAFANCPKLQVVYAPADTVFAEDAFSGCGSVLVSRTAG